LYAAMQPPTVPDRGPRTHSVPTNFDPAVSQLLVKTSLTAQLKRTVRFRELLDARLLEAPGGLIVPIANYEEKIGQQVGLNVRTDRRVTKVSSAYHGELKWSAGKGTVSFTIPALGYGDVVRLDVAK